MKQSNGVEEEGELEVFRVRVSLERYFSDERARCYMSVLRGRPVRALARRLRRTFRLPRPFALVSRGHLLPPDEPLALLHPDDPVDVIPTKWTATLVPETNEDDKCPSFKETSSHSLQVDLLASDVLDSVSKPAPTPPAPAPTPIALALVPAPVEPALGLAPRETLAAIPEGKSGNLEHMKRRALELLDEYEPPARRRRRVRRRRPARRELAHAGEEPRVPVAACPAPGDSREGACTESAGEPRTPLTAFPALGDSREGAFTESAGEPRTPLTAFPALGDSGEESTCERAGKPRRAPSAACSKPGISGEEGAEGLRVSPPPSVLRCAPAPARARLVRALSPAPTLAFTS